MREAYNHAVAQVLARTEYGIRTETALANGSVINWSNSSRTWNRVIYKKVKRGEQVTLDANEVIVYALPREVDRLATHLPALPLDAFSHEAKERGPEQFLSNPGNRPSLVDFLTQKGIDPRMFSELTSEVRLYGMQSYKDRAELDWAQRQKTKYDRLKQVPASDEAAMTRGEKAVSRAIDEWLGGFTSNPKSPEEEWINLPESSEGVHEHHDPTHSPYEGDIPPWGQQGYGGSFPMAGRVYYVNAYAVVEYKTGISFSGNLQKYGTHHSVGVFPQHLTSADFDYYPFAAIPVRREEGANPSYFFKYLERMAPKVPLQFLKIVIENDFPKGMQHSVYDPEAGREVVSDIRGKVKLPDDRYFEYTMLRPFKHPRVEYVNAYVENRLYGGPEEGGWWYNAGFPVAAIPYIKNGEYTNQKMKEYLENSIGYHSKYPLSSVLGHDAFSITTEDAFPMEYPSETPHYE